MLSAFRPTDYKRIHRRRLHAVKQRSPNGVTQYINEFNDALVACDDVSDQEALFLFEEGLHPQLVLTVYTGKYGTLSAA